MIAEVQALFQLGELDLIRAAAAVLVVGEGAGGVVVDDPDLAVAGMGSDLERRRVEFAGGRRRP